jgi:hypothetical protein
LPVTHPQYPAIHGSPDYKHDESQNARFITLFDEQKPRNQPLPANMGAALLPTADRLWFE